MTHSLPSCPGSREVTSPTARQEKPLDYSPAGGPRAGLLAVPECARGGAEKAEAAAGPHGRGGSPCGLWTPCAGSRAPLSGGPPGRGLAWGQVHGEGNSYFALYKFV